VAQDGVSRTLQVTIESSGRSVTRELSAAEYTVGRDTACDIVVDVPFVSRRHARLIRQDRSYRYVHEGSNPTLLKGAPIVDRVVQDGDELLVGSGRESVRFIFRFGTSKQTQAPRDLADDQTNSGFVDLAVGDKLRIGREAGNDLVLDSPVISRRHAAIERFADGVHVRDLGSTNGTFLNGNAITVAVMGEGDSVRIGPYKLLLRGARLWQYDTSRYAEVRGYHLTRYAGGRLILDDVSVAALPGEVTAIAGVSGAGKSTLLSALNGLVPADAGTVLINDENLYWNYGALQLLFGYVPQADIVHRELALGDALRAAAQLRLPIDTPPNELEGRLDETLDSLDLLSRKDQQIKKMSGGQQKRASLAIELIARPPLLLLDEPTTGLDPGLRRQLMQLLRQLAAQGRTVLLVTHDPDSLSYSDQLIFLASGGRVAYMGPTADALDYFGAPDFVDVYTRVEQQSTPEDWQFRFRASTQHRRYLEQRLPEIGTIQVDGTVRRGRVRPPLVPKLETPAERRVVLHQVGVLARRYLKVLLNDRRNLALLLMQAPVLALLLALVSNSDDLTGAQETGNAKRLLLLLATCGIWLGTINAAREIVKELPVFIREQLMGVSPLTYMASKVVVLSALSLVQSSMLLLVLGVAVELPSDGVILPGPLEMYFSLTLASLAAMSIGLLVSALSTSQERAMTIVPLVLIPQIIFAGVIFDLSGVADGLSILSLGRWAVELLGATSGVPGGAYARTAGHQLIRWLILIAMFVLASAATLWVLSRKDGQDLARA